MGIMQLVPGRNPAGNHKITKRGDWTWHSQKNEASPHIWWDKKEREKHWKTRGNLFQKYVWTFRILEIVTVSMIIKVNLSQSKSVCQTSLSLFLTLFVRDRNIRTYQRANPDMTTQRMAISSNSWDEIKETVREKN